MSNEDKKPEDISERVKRIRKMRRDRGETGEMAGLRLGVNKSKLDPRFKYRWVNQSNLAARQNEATFTGDWELVENHDGALTDGRNMEESGTITRLGEREQGTRMFLMRKPVELYEDDQQLKIKRTKDLEKSMIQKGAAHDAQGLTADQQHYTPSEVRTAGRKTRR